MARQRASTEAKMVGHYLRVRRQGCLRVDYGLPLLGTLSQGDVKLLLETELHRLLGDDTYEQIERGRILPGTALLEDLMTLYRLSQAEREYLYRLANRPVPGRPLIGTDGTLSHTLREHLAKLAPWPAYVMNPLWDVVAANTATQAVFPALRHTAPEDRNVVWLMLTDAGRDLHSQIRDSKAHACRIVAQFRQVYSVYRGNQSFEVLIARLRKASPLFVELWDTGSSVSYRAPVAKDVVDPRVDRRLWPTSDRVLCFQQCTWLMLDGSGLALVSYEPRDAATVQALEELTDQASAGSPAERERVRLVFVAEDGLS